MTLLYRISIIILITSIGKKTTLILLGTGKNRKQTVFLCYLSRKLYEEMIFNLADRE